MTTTGFIDAINAVDAELNLEPLQEGPLQHMHKAQGPIYPRLATHEGIMIRTLAIVDNLDEVIMLPQGFVFPLRVNQRKRSFKRRIDQTGPSDESSLHKKKNDQEDYLDYYEE